VLSKKKFLIFFYFLLNRGARDSITCIEGNAFFINSIDGKSQLIASQKEILKNFSK